MQYVIALSLAGAAVPVFVTLASRDQALRSIGMTVLKYVVVMPAAATAVAVGLFYAIA